MKKLVIGGFLAASALALGCGAAKSKIDPINDNEVKVNNAIFDIAIQSFDSDGDGTNDLDATTFEIIASDQDDLCAKFEADANFDPADLDDVNAVSAIVLRADAIGAGGVAEGDVLTSNTDLFTALLAPAAGQVFAEGIVLSRAGGVDLINAAGDALTNFVVGDASLEIVKFEDGVNTKANFTTTLTGDTADPAKFDVDADGQGVCDNDATLTCTAATQDADCGAGNTCGGFTNDFQAITSALQLKVKKAAFCDALLQ